MIEEHPTRWIGKRKNELDTPCLVVDIDLLDANISKMQSHVTAQGKQLRPHAKTHKCSTIAHRQIAGGAVGICAAKVSEALVLVNQGVSNVLITGPLVTTEKINIFLDCLRIDPGCSVVVDSLEGAQLLHQALGEQGLRAMVLIDIEIGQKRTGVLPEKALDLFQRVTDLPTLQVAGIQAYAGHVQHIHSGDERRAQSIECLQRAVEVRRQIQAVGLPCEVLSGGGTGTYDIDVEVPEMTELQAGSYVFMDEEYFVIESTRHTGRFEDFQPALTLLSTVVSANQTGFVTIDAGLKAIYRDGPAPIPAKSDQRGYTYEWFGDEFGKLIIPEVESYLTTVPKVGECIELIVSHGDPTVNLYDYFFVTQNDIVIDVWRIDLRGKSQ